MCVVIATVLGCRNGPESVQYGAAFNARRVTLGLPQVQSTWTERLRTTECVWLSPQALKEGVASHHRKKIAWDAAGPLWEEDAYYSGKRISLKALDPDATEGWEELVCRYSFRNEANPWECFYTSTAGLKVIDLVEAKRLLDSWGCSWDSP